MRKSLITLLTSGCFLLIFTQLVYAELSITERLAVTQIIKKPVRSINPSYLGAFGFAQVIDREGGNIRAHWRGIRRAIENVDNNQPQGSNHQNNDPLHFMRSNDKKAIIRDIENIEYYSRLLQREDLSADQVKWAENKCGQLIQSINSKFYTYGKDPLFISQSPGGSPDSKKATCPPGTKESSYDRSRCYVISTLSPYGMTKCSGNYAGFELTPGGRCAQYKDKR